MSCKVRAIYLLDACAAYHCFEQQQINKCGSFWAQDLALPATLGSFAQFCVQHLCGGKLRFVLVIFMMHDCFERCSLLSAQ